ncbi:glycosyltransferase family 2 protein [Chloroflexales bacterium ZM16-3]|nr:glycosyltransferase family 2 protein [Chloroflexales bacterium ZM16-3]
MQPRISFGVIVLNGEPFTRYTLRAIYPFAHEIIVVEGASPHSATSATPDGHSHDGTLNVLRRFQAEEDPEGKVVLITAEDQGYPNGFWPGEKDEQSQAYARRATGDWLWQVDIDEFYQPNDMCWIIENLLPRPEVAVLSVHQLQFWGGINYLVDGWYQRHYGGDEIPRIFRWGPGYRYTSHRPATVVNRDGVDLRQLGWVRSRDLIRRGIYMYHYSLVFPQQVWAKSGYYSSIFGRPADYAESNFATLRRIYRVHNVTRYPSWLEAYRGGHPPQIAALWDDIRAGRLPVELRPSQDIDQLLARPGYQAGRLALRLYGSLRYTAQLAAHRLLARATGRQKPAIRLEPSRLGHLVK